MKVYIDHNIINLHLKNEFILLRKSNLDWVYSNEHFDEIRRSVDPEKYLTVLKELISNNELNLEVHLIGNGPLAAEIPVHKNIKHTAFVNPDNLPALLENAGYFILPSLYEAWGVVVQEAVLAGLPVITTYETGAASDFVIHNFNGFVYEANDSNKLKQIIRSLDNVSIENYLEMSKNSKTMAAKINLDEWSAKLNSIVQ